MMNELYIGKGWIYEKTKETSAEIAVNTLISKLAKIGIELTVEEAVLRDENENDMEIYK